jgi:hypothetical protein
MRTGPSFLCNPFSLLLLGFFCFTLSSLWQVRSSYGQEASITDFTVSNSENSLLVYLTVADCFNQEMEAAVQNGIHITFVFSIELFAKRPNWPDRKMREQEFTHSMEYDSLKKEYLVHREEKGDSKVTSSLEEARKLMSEVNGFRIMPLDELDPMASYTVRAKAKLARKTMPLYFHYLVPFSSPWNFDTGWRELTLRLAQ